MLNFDHCDYVTYLGLEFGLDFAVQGLGNSLSLKGQGIILEHSYYVHGLMFGLRFGVQSLDY